MAKGKRHTGIVLESDAIKIAVIEVSNKNIELIKLDKFSLISPIEKTVSTEGKEDVFGDMDADLGDDSVFDLDLEADLGGELDDDDLDLSSIDTDDVLGDLGDDLGLELDDYEEGEDDLGGVDMVDESATPANNEMLLYNILTSIDTKKVTISLNIPAGVTIFQILRDFDFNDVKKKDLQVIIDDRLESLYGNPKGKDFYSYSVRDDGSMLLASIDDEPQMLQLVNRTLPLYRGKLMVDGTVPDEIILIGMIKANYELNDGGITCVIQFGEKTCRVIFLKDDKLWLVTPVITEGTKSKKFLNTVFSKILFQLDTGEVPNLDRLIICNNSLGEEATNFFKERFPDVAVSDFSFTEGMLEPNEYSPESITPFTTAIGAAWSTSGLSKGYLPEISFLPKYIQDRQKIFKLQWHGFLILCMILISFPVMNELYRNYNNDIRSMENEVSILDTQIESYALTVNNYNRINNELSQIQEQLTLMNILAENTVTWSTNLNILNSGIDLVNGVWLTSVSSGSEPNTLRIEGISRYRSRVHLIADLFSDATLLSVSGNQIREQDIYNFVYEIGKIVPNTNVYTPNNLEGLEELVGN